MKSYFFRNYLCFIVLVFVIGSITLVSCNKESENRANENIKDAKKQELIFQNISKAWVFSYPNLNPETQVIVNNWNEWRLFLDEIEKKPKSTIGAFQKKAKALTKRAVDLKNNIPQKFNKPEIRSRISVLISKVNMIDLYINLHQIPDEKIIVLIKDVNIEISSLSQQMNEILRKENIPLEEGESDMIKMLDTSRAIPTSKFIK